VTTRAKEPFHFFTRLSLTVLTGIKAKDLKELLECIKTVPESVIYEHTHRFLRQHQDLVPEPSSDFSYWATHILQDEVLGERLAAIDTIRFSSLNDLRQAVVTAIENHLKKNDGNRRVPAGKEFYFRRAIRFSLPTPYLAYNLAEFLECLKKVSVSSLYLHIFEARLRPPLGNNDFSQWFETELGEKTLAKKVAGLDPYNQNLDGLRSKITGFIEKRLQEAPRAAT
jgi:hypothetical protein